jgi:hypothetical protein
VGTCRYVKEFQKCLDKTEPIPFSEIQRTIQQELSRPLDSVFVSIDPKPLASASIAQVRVLCSFVQALVDGSVCAFGFIR